jgi:AGZA family xanthine/uracil permease-like MFS transporter
MFEKLFKLFEKLFKLKENKTNVRTELIAGVTTFFTMAYIIFVNPNVLGNTGMDKGGVFLATCIAAAIGTLLMAFLANLPFAQAPGMGLNAFFTYTLVFGMGYTWQQALGAVFCSGILFIIITFSGLREKIIEGIPTTLKFAISGGIGLFIAILGFKDGGMVVSKADVDMGSIAAGIAKHGKDVNAVKGDLFTNFGSLGAGKWYTDFGNFADKGVLLTIIGVIIILVLMLRKVKGSILIGIIATTIIGIPMGITKVGNTMTPNLHGFLKLDLAGLFTKGPKNLHGSGPLMILLNLFMVVLCIFLVDMFDNIGTLVGTATKAGMIDKTGRVLRLEKALYCDAFATTIGSLFGTSTVTTYIESASGVEEGGRTGLTSLVTGVLFILAIFAAPLVGIVPSQATAPALIVVGVLMASSLMRINFDDLEEAIPAFFTVVIMPFTTSIANGIAVGLILYPIVKIVRGKAKDVSPIVYVLAALFLIRFILLATVLA